MQTTTFALIDNASGFVWWVGTAESAEAACAAADLDIAGEAFQYIERHRLEGNETGYFVFEAPAGFTVEDGQDPDAIAAVETFPLAGRFARI